MQIRTTSRKNNSFAEADHTRYALTVPAVPLAFLSRKMSATLLVLLHICFASHQHIHIDSCTGTKNTVDTTRTDCHIQAKGNIWGKTIHSYCITLRQTLQCMELTLFHIFSSRETHRGRSKNQVAESYTFFFPGTLVSPLKTNESPYFTTAFPSENDHDQPMITHMLMSILYIIYHPSSIITLFLMMASP